MTTLPTQAMKEAAARAMYEFEPHFNAGVPLSWLELNEHVRVRYRQTVTVALTAAMPLMLEDAAKVALDEKVNDTGEETDTAYNLACDHIAAVLRNLTPT